MQLQQRWAGAQGLLEGCGQGKALGKISWTFRAEKGEGRGQEEEQPGGKSRGVTSGPLLHS